MKKLVDDPRLIYKCCDLYYRQEKSQQEICDIFGVSRPSVSRMLKSGRELGIVRIEIVNPDATAYGQLERQLEEAFSLKEAIVVCDSPAQSGAEVRLYPIWHGCCTTAITLGFLWDGHCCRR